jgi:hypothetical protein
MTLSQNESGRAFEYGLAISLSNQLPAPIRDDSPARLAKRCFEKCSEVEKENIVRAAAEVALFLIAHDNRLSNSGCSIRIQPDSAGKKGNVRDIVVTNNRLEEEIGISAKHRHHALKLSRLSEQIDFGWDWFRVHCSAEYFHQIVPIFRELRTRQRNKERWRDIANKRQLYYLPVLHAFSTEVQRLFSKQSSAVAEGLIHYLLGRHDFYKIIKENGEVSFTSFNIDGSLKWGSKIPLPTRIIEIAQKPRNETTLLMTFDHGWQVSFRIHNASTNVEPSLKFDINMEGMPSLLSRHISNYTG